MLDAGGKVDRVRSLRACPRTAGGCACRDDSKEERLGEF